jgi:hypothetical protein
MDIPTIRTFTPARVVALVVIAVLVFGLASKTDRFVAAAGRALVGAVLGFNATQGSFALITTIIGSAVGANLAAILLDISRARRGRLLVPSVPSD